MGQVLHGRAHTTEAIRRAIQRSEESIRALAGRYGISPTTVQKWRKRATVVDAPMGPTEVPSSVLTVEEDAMIVAFRRYRILPDQPYIDAFSGMVSAGCPIWPANKTESKNSKSTQ